MFDDQVLILRTVSPDLRSYGAFQWPAYGPVEAPDWKPTIACGNGLHGLLYGEGDGSLLDWSEDARWLVFTAPSAGVIDLGGKVKVAGGFVEIVGTRSEVTDWLAKQAPGRSIVGLQIAAGDRGTATAGYGGTATAGDGGTATAGYRGTATAGYGGTATAGDGGTATAGYGGTATAGYGGTATAGYGGTATAGYGGTATAGDRGTATAGYGGTATAGYEGAATAGYGGAATAGYGGTATAGYGGTATAGDRGVIQIAWSDGIRRRVAIGYIGEENLKAGVKYGFSVEARRFLPA